MNKKLLFAAMSLVAFTACTDNDFESQKVAEEVGSVQFKVLNNNDAFTRASMDGNNIVWNANEGDLFTLYHGAAADAVKGFENACYKAEYGEDGATLSTPTMIREGKAIMVWPVDTTFRITTDDDLTLTIPAVLKAKDPKTGKGGVENAIPYVSDLVGILAYDPDKGTADEGTRIGNKNTAGKDREYPVYMRPMASQLNLKADYVGNEMKAIEDLTKLSDDPIKPITLTSVVLKTTGDTKFTTTIPVKWTDPGDGATDGTIKNQWKAAKGNNWEKVTDFNVGAITGEGQTQELTTKVIEGTERCKFLFLPQAPIGADGVIGGAVIFNTYYGKVEVSAARYTGDGEYDKAWYRFVTDPTKPAAHIDADAETVPAGKETAGEGAGKYKVTANIAKGMKQTINFFSTYTATSGIVKNEPRGTAVTRYVNVLLKYLDMSDLHIKDDQQLRDVVRVWKELKLAPVTVYLDGDANKEFEISQKTIAKINEINAGTLKFKVQPCQKEGEVCNTIVIKDGGNVPNIAFIAANGMGTPDDATDDVKANVVLKAGATWTWVNNVDVTASGVAKIINKGAMQNTTGATLKTKENGTDGAQNNVPLVNDGTWTISGGELNVQFDVTNNGTVTIAAGAEYRQAKGSANTTFINEATAVPSRFTLAAAHDDAKIGKVVNNGVFATLATDGSQIINYGVIEHASAAAKTYITKNQTDAVDFATAFGDANKMGMIIIDYSNKDEDNISVSHALNEGFVAVKVNADNAPSDKKLNATVVGPRVNYVIINGGIETIEKLPAQIQYVEINDVTANPAEIAWSLIDDPTTVEDEAKATYQGLMVLTKVNIKLGTTITVAKATYLGANMYVGGIFNKGSWTGYYGITTDNEATKYITY